MLTYDISVIGVHRYNGHPAIIADVADTSDPG